MVTKAIRIRSAAAEPLVVRALNDRMHEVWSGVVEDTTEVTLPEGVVVLKGTYADGREAQEVIDTSRMEEVTFERPETPSAGPERWMLLSDTKVGFGRYVTRGDLARRCSVRAAVWSFAGGAWRVTRTMPTDVPHSRFLHVIVDEDHVGTSSALPPGGKLVCGTEATIRIEGMNRDAWTLARMLAAGDARAASVYFASRSDQTLDVQDAPPETDVARRLLGAKFRDPFGAAVGAFVLLRSDRFGEVPEWFNRLANSFNLPDGAVARARQILQTGGNLADARELLLVATNRGVPLLTEAFRILLDDLALFRRKSDGSVDDDVSAALVQLRRYSDHAIWTAPLTTFRGSPGAPGASAPPGARYTTLGFMSPGAIFEIEDNL